MVKNNSQSTAEWPTSAQRVRKRRDSKVPYNNNSRYSHRNVPGSSTPAIPSRPRPNVQVHQQSPPSQSNQPELLDFYDLQTSSTGSSFDHLGPRDDGTEVSWLDTSMISYTLPTRPPNSPQCVANGSSSPSNVQSNGSELQFSWQGVTLPADNFVSDMDLLSPSDVSHFGSYGSFDNLAFSMPNTAASSISETYACTGSASGFESPGAQLHDLSLPEGFYQARHAVEASPPASASPTSPQYNGVFPFEGDFKINPDWNGGGDIYTTDGGQLSSSTLTQTHNESYSHIGPILSDTPWHFQNAQNSNTGQQIDTGCVAFEPARGPTYETHRIGEEFLQVGSRVNDTDPVSPAWDADSEQWQLVTSYSNSTVRSEDSPQPESSPWSHVSTPNTSASPSQQQAEAHSHVFSAFPGVSSQKLPRGRQRALTSQEKREALDVRKAKACWACHLSKIKCSPCSPGSPCQQCERLSGKRRFCWLDCFNDPLESLQTFVAPDYLFKNTTQAHVEWFINQNVTYWGSLEIHVRMNWGYRRSLDAIVVPLNVRNGSQLACRHIETTDEMGNSTIVEKKSLPLGIPLAAMEDMQDQYSSLVQDIAKHDLASYVSIAYYEDSDLPERLLGAVSNFYRASLAAGEECEMLRQVIEIHITSTILERSLALDDESLSRVNDVLQEDFPSKSASRCVSRQIKLAFFELQRTRIIKVLESWGAMMWTSNKNTTNDRKWAQSFSVLLALTLVMDKMLETAYYFCETEIMYRGAPSRSERAKFQELVRLTEKELFDRCKEIFHSSFKTRKGGKEACNPIRDGIGGFRGKAVNEGISRFVWDLEAVLREFGPEIRSYKLSRLEDEPDESPYTNAARLASIFLSDFLDH